jgi:murein L,D-transpeptidase YafK
MESWKTSANFSGWLLLSLLLASGVADSSTITQRRSQRPSPDRSRQATGRNGEKKRVEEQFSLVVKKSERKLYLYDGGQRLLKTYHVALGSHPKGHKLRQGDGATPEGDYYIRSCLLWSR